MSAGAGFLLLLFAPGAAAPQCYEVHIGLQSGVVPLQAHRFAIRWHPQQGASGQPSATATPCMASLPGLPAALSWRPAATYSASVTSSQDSISYARTAAPLSLPAGPAGGAGRAAEMASPVASLPSHACTAGTNAASCRAGSPVQMRGSSPRAAGMAAILPSSTAAGSGWGALSGTPLPHPCWAATEVQPSPDAPPSCPAAAVSLDGALAALQDGDAQQNEKADPVAWPHSPPAPSPAHSPPLPQLHPRPPSAGAVGICNHASSSSSSSSGGGSSEQGDDCFSPRMSAQ